MNIHQATQSYENWMRSCTILKMLALTDDSNPLVAPGYYGTVAASGVSFKIHPNNKREAEFVVSPGKAYIYRGPGAVEQVR
jgi:hypothetical protein